MTATPAHPDDCLCDESPWCSVGNVAIIEAADTVRKVKVRLTKTMIAEVEVDAPDIADEIDWHDEVKRLAWERQEGYGAWSEGDETAEIVEGQWEPKP